MGFDIYLPEARIAASRGLWPDRLPVDYLDDAVRERPDATAFVGWNSALAREVRLTYAELGARVDRIAAGLLERGVRKGDVVAFQLPNWWEFTALLFACNRIGAVANPLMPIFRQRELRFMLGFAEAKVAIVPALWRGFDHLAMLREIGPELPRLEHVFAVGGSGESSFERAFLDRPALSSTERQRLAGLRPGPNDVVELIYTSGTSGQPKAVMHTANTVLAPAQCFIDDIGLSGRDVVFMGSPFAHQTGFLYGILMPVMLATKAVALDIWSAREAVPLIEREGATFSMGSTPFLSDIVNLPEEARARVSPTLRTWVCAGAPIPRVLVQRAKSEMNLDVLSCWGMTENAGLTITRKQDPQEKVFETDGRALPGSEVRVVDDAKRPLPADTVGHLQARGITHFVGYLKRPELNSIDAEGWFDTGDLARMDKDGYIRIVGRTKDVIIRGGENIPVAEVENLIYRHPQVAECAVVAMPDARLGERACAFVIPKAGAALDLGELTRFLGEQGMAKPYWPERLELVAEMPRTPSGKIQKFKLREVAAKLGS
ncbi:MAG TPA: AMP-binding protein [Hyphomicrobiaceae bacterium]|nr:AMP-binding protein [Hyphomicrobiaceae bacterium]